MRKALIAGNWKMNKTVPEAVSLANSIKAGLYKVSDVEVVLCPPFTALDRVARALEGTNIAVGAQDMHYETEGAFTGEVSPLILKDIGCRYVILGHSERRHGFGESDELINKKLKAALKYNLIPIVCVGETLEERDRGEAREIVRRQFEKSLASITQSDLEKIVIAYEPVWAIGTGRTATPQQAQEMHAYVRSLIKGMFHDGEGDVRILYGGSVRQDNIEELLREPDLDGALVGGASLKAEIFIQIVHSALARDLVHKK